MVSTPGLPTVSVLLRLEKFTDLLKVESPWVWCLYVSFIFIFQEWFYFFYGWRGNFEAWKIWRQIKKEAKNTVGGGRKNWFFNKLIVSCIYLMHLEGVCESWILNVQNVQHWGGRIVLNSPRYTYSEEISCVWEGNKTKNPPIFMSPLYHETRLLCRYWHT